MANAKKDVLADFKVAPARKSQYEPSHEGFGPVGAPEISDKATAHRGKRVRDSLPCYYVQDGSNQPFALPLSCASAIVSGGLLTVDEICEMWDDRSRALALKNLEARKKGHVAPAADTTPDTPASAS